MDVIESTISLVAQLDNQLNKQNLLFIGFFSEICKEPQSIAATLTTATTPGSVNVPKV